MNKTKIIIITSLAVIIVVASAFFLTQDPQHDSSATKYGSESVNPSSDTPKSTSIDNPGGATNTKEGGDSSSNPELAATTAPLQPNGTFVSNHRPNLSGSPSPNSISSTCTTTPGASCTIRFMKDGVTRTLPTQRTDADGNTNWSWKLQDIGITVGEWKITAVSINGDKEASSEDVIPFVVGT